MTDFVASNTAEVKLASGRVEIRYGLVTEVWLDPWAVQALREFFQAEVA